MSTDRDSQGRFQPGNAGGPGRPRRATEREYLAALRDGCSADDWHEIVQRAVRDAKQGDHSARKWLGAYLVGEPGSRSHSLHLLAVEEAADGDPVRIDVARYRSQEAVERALLLREP